MSTNLTYTVEDGVALIGLNRPASRNAISRALSKELQEAVAQAGEEARVGVIYGHGDHFSAGLDLIEARELMASGAWYRSPLHVNHPPAYEGLARGAIPIITALQGAVIGAGFELAAASHIRVADETVFFALPEGQRGIFVGGGGSVRISRLIGYPDMVDMMLTGRTISAAEAESRRVVQYMTSKGKALEKARELADKIKGNTPVANFAIINALSRIQGLSQEDGLFFERVVAGLASRTGDAERRLDAFKNKTAEPLKKSPS